MQLHEFLENKISPIIEQLDNGYLQQMFYQCFFNTLETTTRVVHDNDTYVFTGDIPAMWLRDSSAQVKQYLPFLSECEPLRQLIKGLIKRQFMYIRVDPYANAFNEFSNGHGHKDRIEQNPMVWERKYEIDALCYPIELIYKYWQETHDDALFDDEFLEVMKTIVRVWVTEQRHDPLSDYGFIRDDCPLTDTLSNNGKGSPVGYTGMTWSGFRPSDDACTYGYLIPSNMFAVVVLGYMSEILLHGYDAEVFYQKVIQLKEEIHQGIETYGTYDHPQYGRIYAYEVDGFGHQLFMDDANVPSLLSIPYIGYMKADDPMYLRTRAFILSQNNPYYFTGSCAQGIGSPHTPKDHIWPIALGIQGLTSTTLKEKRNMIKVLCETECETGYMHESFDVHNPNTYTRPWFAWANAVFSELILDVYRTKI